MPTKTAIFRQVSLDRLSSPEQLDQLLVITGARTWWALAAMLALLAAACVWGFAGQVVTTADGTGVIVRQGGVLNIVTHGAGVLTTITAKPGSHVQAHEVVATIEQPALVQQIASLNRAREEAVTNRDHNLRSDSNAAHLAEAANRRERTNREAQIGELQERMKLLEQQIGVEQQLFEKGLATNQQVLDIRQKLIGVQDEVAQQKASLVSLDAQQFEITAQPSQKNVEWQMRVTELDRQIATATDRLNQARHVVSPYDGEVLEVKTSPGSTVTEGEPVVSIQPRQEKLEVLAYVPSLQAKALRTNLDVEISPSSIKREEYGFMRGRVDFVADFPATEAAMMRNFENGALVKALSERGPVTEVRATLDLDPATPTGFAWSTSTGPNVVITSGTLCDVNVVTKREKPISLIFPYLRSKLGS
jgi:HlyD family secretion protein